MWHFGVTFEINFSCSLAVFLSSLSALVFSFFSFVLAHFALPFSLNPLSGVYDNIGKVFFFLHIFHTIVQVFAH